MPKNYKKKNKNQKKTKKKNTTTGEPYDGRPPREQLTNIKDWNAPITVVEKNKHAITVVHPAL